MRLTKLEMNGFKSFAKKTEIDFQNGITAVIGPNGCGKSNIADAVRWVLGEQSARALRGTRMEDVIFNGTEQRKAQAFCEVALTFDNTDESLPSEFSEVSVMRRVYRSGESEYYINRTPCRLKDIGELFRDTGIGRDGYSIIGQGRVEEILSNKSNDRRAAFEEAAGVMKYRVRKEEAERKLDNTRKNLERLTDILDELGRQVGPLEEQSAAAREYLKLRDELKDIEINVFLYQYDRLNEKLANLTATTKQIDDELASNCVAENTLASACSFEEENERALSATITGLQNRLLALSSNVEEQSGEAKLAGERMANLIKERERLTAQIDQNSARHAELKSKVDAADSGGGEGREKLAVMQQALSEALRRTADADAEITGLEELLEQQKNSIIEAMNRLSDAKSLISRFDAMNSALNDRLSVLDEEEEQLAKKQSGLDEELSHADGYLSEIMGEYDHAAKRRAGAITEQNELMAALNGLRASVHTLEQTEQEGRSRIKVLEEMKRAHEGYYASVKNVLRDAARDMELHKRIEGVVAELIRVPKEYETAVEMTLGSALQNIVTPNEQDAKYVIEYLRSRQYGRATLLPVSGMRPRLLNDQEKQFCEVDGYIGVASELVGFDPRYRGIMENLLGRTVIVRDLDAGIAINKRARSSFRIATMKGDIINPGGSMTGGSVQKREFSLIGREREIEDLKIKLASVAEELASNSEKEQEHSARLEALGLYIAELNETVHARDVEVATQREKVDIIKKYVEQNRAEMEDVELERSRINDNLQNIAEQKRSADEAQSSIEQGSVATQDDIRRTQQRISDGRAELARLNEDVTARKVELMALSKELDAAQNDAKRMAHEAEQLKNGIDGDKRTVDSFKGQFAQLQEQLDKLDVNIGVGRKDKDELTDQLHAMEEERAKHQQALDESRERRERLAIEIADLKERRHRTELNSSRSQLELTNMQDRIWDDYELTYENALPQRHEIAVTASHMRIGELKTAIRELGDVNISSIEDYKIVKERFESLDTQCADLTRAEADLQQIIGELADTMESEFKKQFSLIQQNFSQVFTELFGGGRAELVLADSSDVLNCDIDIIAQPPGKKLQLLTLLSGGERALTAIALLFAILKLKPTAFCILDEIETSLDEVNVANFAEYVKKYSEDTQFIIITHRKGSMEVCDSLYGVSMEEKGVSKVVSAKFSQTA